LKTLILGDSFTDTWSNNWHGILFDDYDIYAKGGVDNSWISRTGIHLLSERTYDNVFVMFTGINRTSIPLPTDTIPEDYYFNFPITQYRNGLHLIQSGGSCGTWDESKTLDKSIKDIFKKQYSSDNLEFFTHLSMYDVIAFLSFLEARNIKHKYTFIYDVFKKGDRNEHCLGVCRNLDYWELLNKQNYIPLPPYQYGRDNDCLDEDGFHLTKDGQAKWAKEVKKYLT